MLETIESRWRHQRCVVAASGPSLTPEVTEACRGERIIAVNVGFDMHGGHFFGEHPQELNGSKDHSRFIPHFEKAAEMLPDGVRIVNATAGSALRCFPLAMLEDALR